MRTVELLFAAVWGAFWLAWLLAASSVKRSRIPWRRVLGIRVVLALVVILLVRVGAFRDHGLHVSGWETGTGLALLVLGLGFAVWARVHIGRNCYMAERFPDAYPVYKRSTRMLVPFLF